MPKSVDSKELARFLVKAKTLTYASGTKDFSVTPALKNSHQLEYGDGNFRYHDIYYGGLHFIGMETVFHVEKPIWGMSYYGGSLPGSNESQISGMPSVLKAALRKVSLEAPFRGPTYFKKGYYHYENMINGDIFTFYGTEVIRFQKQKIYSLNYSGGVIE